ncbi:hypothetical protein BGZ50_000313 [Haplosporangium sp. Z 11]|nr:hypothetical protein BGZ50_000313 [Haplosporangium sp. Z 11]
MKKFVEFAGLRGRPSSLCSIPANVQEAFVMCIRIVYSPEMPATIPKRVLVRRAIDKLAKVIQIILRAILVASIWLIMLPYFTIWIWRLYFWIGETFAFRANGLETPVWNATTFFASRHNLTATPIASAAGTDKILDGISLLVFQSIAPEHQWISKFIVDCFEGQIISSVVVVVFLAIFLLREWVVQNQENDAARIAMNLPAEMAQGVEAEAQGFNVEHAVERFIAAQHHIEAVVEGDAELTDEDEDLDGGVQQDTSQRSESIQTADSEPAQPWNLSDFSNRSEASREEPVGNMQERPRFFWETNNSNEDSSSSRNLSLAPMGSWLSESGSASGSTSGPSTYTGGMSRPSNERTHSSDPTSGIIASINIPDKNGRRPGNLNGRLNQEISFRAPEDMPVFDDISPPSSKIEFIYDPLRRLYYPDPRWAAGTSASAASSSTTPIINDEDQRAGGSGWFQSRQDASANDNGEGVSSGSQPMQDSDIIYTRHGTPLYLTEKIPMTFETIYLNPDDSEMSYSQKLEQYEFLCKTGMLTDADLSRLARSLRPLQAEKSRQHVEGSSSGLDIRVQQRQEMVRQINDRGIRMRFQQGALPPPGQNLPQVGNPPAPNAAPRAPPAVPPPPPPPRAPLVAVNPDDDFEDLNVEELEGILEVIGMHGSYWILLQNSLLMSALVCASLGLGIWIPFMIGKTMLLMNPLNVLHIPLFLLSRLTDPILDYFLDRIVPFVGRVVSKTAMFFNLKLWPYVSPILESYLGVSTMKPLEAIFQDHVLPVWNAMIEVVASGMAQEIPLKGTTDAMMDPVIQGQGGGSNATVVHLVVKKWTEVAYGSSSRDKFVAIMIGYAILFALASWYFAQTQNAYGRSFAKATRESIRQQGLILKIAFFVAIEMIVFPLFCGIVIGMSTLPVFRDATVASRIAFYMNSPNWFLIIHWLVGTAFMFNFSVFVGFCRERIRPGVMWFIRDPNDQGFHPVREILERPVMLQLRKLGNGALMYFTLIILGITMTTHAVNLVMKGVFPLYLPVDHPISDIPLDMLFHLVFPLTVRWLNPKERATTLFSAWWRHLARWLRLSSFMYAAQGQRYYDEEGHFEYRTWKAWLLRSRPPIPGMDDVDEHAVGSGEELDIDAPVVFVRDGGLIRVPNTDRVVHLKNRRVLVPVDANGNALDPDEDLPGEIDPLMELQPLGRDAHRAELDPKANTIIVYAPPNFMRRLIAFVVLLWTSVMSFLVLSIVVPTVLGRALFALMMRHKVHDIYPFVAGLYFLSALWFILDWTISKYHIIASRGLQPIDARTLLRSLSGLCELLLKIVYLGLAFGVIMPFALGFIIELYVIMPLRINLDDHTGIMFVLNWAVGLLYLRIIYRFVTLMPNNRFAVDLNRVFNGANVHNWDAGLATRRLILPILGLCALTIIIPFCIAWLIVNGLGLMGATRLRVFRHVYPAVLMLTLVVFGLRKSLVVIQGWGQYVRDQEYLVGRQLHNLREEMPAGAGNAAPTPLPSQRETSPEIQDDIPGDQDISETASAFVVETKGSAIAPPLLRSNSRRPRDPAIGFDDETDEEVEESIAQRTRSRINQRFQAQ